MNVRKYYSVKEWNALSESERYLIRYKTNERDYYQQRTLFNELESEVLDTVIKTFEYYLQPGTNDGNMIERGVMRFSNLVECVDVVFNQPERGGIHSYEGQAIESFVRAVIERNRDTFYFDKSRELVILKQYPKRHAELEEGDRDVPI